MATVTQKLKQLDKFYAKFKAVPNKGWFVGDYVAEDGKSKCALGILGERDSTQPTKQSQLLRDLFTEAGLDEPSVYNDGTRGEAVGIKGKTPRTRVLNAVKYVKKVIAKSATA